MKQIDFLVKLFFILIEFSKYNIMQRRKIISNLNSKPKLILNRERFLSNIIDKNQENIHISMGKGYENRDTRINVKKVSQNSDMIVKKTRSLQKNINFNIRNLNINSHESECIKNEKDIHNDLFLNSSNVEPFLEDFMKKMKSSPQVFNFSGDITISEIYFLKILRLLIEETFSNSILLTRITAKLNAALFQAQKQESFSQPQKKKTSHRIPNCAITSNIYYKIQPHKIIKHRQSNLKDKTSININQTATTKQFITTSTSTGCDLEEHRDKNDDQKFIFQHLTDLEDYIMRQPNKILHEAVRRHKYLEEELFAYADFLSISKLGAEVYTPNINISAIESNLDREMRQLNKTIIQGEQSLEKKCKMVRDYVLLWRQAYSKIIEQLLGVIDKKTYQTKVFVDKVSKWEENYLTRKEYLANLKIEYFKELQSINRQLSRFRHFQLNPNPENNRFISALEESVASIDKIFLLGNSFY